MDKNRSLKILLAAACCLALVLVPIHAGAQGGIVKGAKEGVQKGAQETEKGAKGAYGKTKEGAEAVGHGTKKAFTGDQNTPSENRMKSTEGQNESTTTQTEEKQMPRTAGELPMLFLTGILSLAGARATRRLK